jgi:hypothetical protein
VLLVVLFCRVRRPAQADAQVLLLQSCAHTAVQASMAAQLTSCCCAPCHCWQHYTFCKAEAQFSVLCCADAAAAATAAAAVLAAADSWRCWRLFLLKSEAPSAAVHLLTVWDTCTQMVLTC